MKEEKKKRRIRTLTLFLIFFFIFSIIAFFNWKVEYTSFDYDECREMIAKYSGEVTNAENTFRDIQICGQQRQRLEFQKDIALAISIIFLFLTLLSLKIDNQ